jgi:hypothetical protein
VNHLIKHSSSYAWRGFARLLEIVAEAPDLEVDLWMRTLKGLHDTIEVSLGTEEHLIIQGFCKVLSKPRKLASRRHVLESIHLAPRVLCDSTPLGVSLSVADGTPEVGAWLQIEYLQGSELRYLTISDGEGDLLSSIAYALNIEDIFPKSGGVLSQGNDVLWWILKMLGVEEKRKRTFQTSIEFTQKQVTSPEKAVLDRLASGNLKVLSDTLVGSPQRIESLVKAGRVVLLPDFNHVGFTPNLLLESDQDRVAEVASFSIESTIFQTGMSSYALVSAPSSWRDRVLSSAIENEVKVWPVIRTSSSRRMIRSEEAFPKDSEMLTWSDGKSK